VIHFFNAVAVLSLRCLFVDSGMGSLKPEKRASRINLEPIKKVVLSKKRTQQ